MKHFLEDCFKKDERKSLLEMALLLDDSAELPVNEKDSIVVKIDSSVITIEPETVEAWEVDRDTLKALIRAEGRPDISKWIYLEHIFEKLTIYALLKKHDISGSLSEKEHLWLQGRGIPLQNYKAMAKARATTGFRQGVEFGLLRPVQLVLYALLIYQLNAAMTAPGKSALLSELWDIAWNGKPQSIRGALSLIVANPQNASYLWPLLSFPLVWGGIKAYLYGRRTLFRSPHNFQKAINALYAHPAPLILSLKGHRFEIISQNRRFWWNFLRWLFPLHYADRQINHLIEALLFNGKLTEDQRQEAFQAIHTFIKRNGGYSRIIGLHAEQLFAAGVALKQFNLLDLEEEEGAQAEFYQARLKEKAQALQLIRSYNPGMMTAWKNDRFWGLIYNSYANYLRWTLGDCESKSIYAGYLIIKTAKIVFLIKLGLNVYNAIIDYLRCPLPYEAQDSFSKIILKKQADYSQACFDSLLRAFNKVPGQPACTLTHLLPQVDIDARTTKLDLSNLGLAGQQVADFLIGLKHFRPDIKITEIDLSGNQINTKEDFEILLPQLKNMQVLRLARNNIEGDTAHPDIPVAGSVALGKGLRALTNLRTLYLSGNQIGIDATTGTEAIGQSLRFLTQLHTLDLSGNQIGLTDATGTKAIGENLHFLAQLRTLNLSGIDIGEFGPTGTQTIGQSLSYLTQLRTLNLSDNMIGAWGTTGTQAIGESLRYLTKLHTLDLSENYIGQTNTTGTVALAENLHFLTQLQDLYLQLNYIGYLGSVGALALLTAVPDLVCQEIKDFNLDINIRNLTWQTDQQLRDAGFIFYSKIQTACKTNTCRGTTVGLPTGITCETRHHIPSDEVCNVFTGTSSSSAAALQPPLPYHLLIAAFTATRAAIASADVFSKDDSNSFILMILGATVLLLTTLLWRSKITSSTASFFHPKEFKQKLKTSADLGTVRMYVIQQKQL